MPPLQRRVRSNRAVQLKYPKRRLQESQRWPETSVYAKVVYEGEGRDGEMTDPENTPRPRRNQH